MKFSGNTLAFFVISAATTTSKGTSTEDIKEAGCNGCNNSFNFLALNKGNKIATITKPSNDFVLSFKLHPYSAVNGPSSMIRFTATSNDCCNYGDRWLAMIFHSNSLKMHFIAGSQSNGNSHFDTDAVVANTWNDIKVEAIGDFIKLYINDEYKGELTNTNRPQPTTVNVYAGDLFSPPANAIIRDYIFTPANEFADYDSLKTAVDLWTSITTDADMKYGHIKYWKTGKITSMFKLFHYKGSFNEDLSLWDTSNVSNMHSMFQYAHAFNGDLNKWDVSKVTTMKYMFYDNYVFNQNISKWNVSKVTIMNWMFFNTKAFNQQLCWDVSGKDMHLMFSGSPGSIGCD